MKVLNNINDYPNLNFRDDTPTEETIANINKYWDELKKESRFSSYLKACPYLHDAYIKKIKYDKDVEIFFETYKDGKPFTLTFYGVKDFRTYKTSEKGKLTRKKVDFDIFGYDSIFIENDSIQYVFAFWQKDWRRQRSHNVCMILCDAISFKI